MTMPDNPRAVIGANEAPDWAKMTVDQLAEDYAGLNKTVAELLDDARALPEEIADDETKGRYTTLIKRLRDTAKIIDSHHAKEKEPHFRRGQGVDQFFFGLWDKLARRDRKAHAGAADILVARLTDYDTRVLAAEQERRRLEFERLERERIARDREQQRLEQEAEQARLAADRARNQEKIEQKSAAADKAEEAASAARVEAVVTEAAAEDARIATLAKPADIMRTRGTDGTLSTMGTEKFAEITDRAALALEPLRPYLPQAALETALRAYAASVGYSNDASAQIAGARFGKKPKSSVR